MTKLLSVCVCGKLIAIFFSYQFPFPIFKITWSCLPPAYEITQTEWQFLAGLLLGSSSVLCYCVKRKCIKVAVEQQALKADSSTKTPQPLTLVVMYIIDASLGVLVEEQANRISFSFCQTC